MLNKVITHLNQVTSEWLTADLSQTPALSNGRVTSFTKHCRGGINRRINIWLPMLQRALKACDDLDCRTIL